MLVSVLFKPTRIVTHEDLDRLVEYIVRTEGHDAASYVLALEPEDQGDRLRINGYFLTSSLRMDNVARAIRKALKWKGKPESVIKGHKGDISDFLIGCCLSKVVSPILTESENVRCSQNFTEEHLQRCRAYYQENRVVKLNQGEFYPKFSDFIRSRIEGWICEKGCFFQHDHERIPTFDQTYTEFIGTFGETAIPRFGLSVARASYNGLVIFHKSNIQ